VAKNFTVGTRGRLNLNLDVYNALNAGWVQGQFETYGPDWRKPSLLLQGRLLQVSGSVQF
jgi:hypothetical protein